ncbi:hypothetical protein PL11_004350 [Lentilactobacillus curieae]|uniref:Uncharacterized protein n=1 Tax=Lentilactobacillus curieae TaxID=1138822 RepID=A0A1S6QHX2_9LACO|nr:hypothetical protein PL11_004350 [Lentilactobacillus curieae]
MQRLKSVYQEIKSNPWETLIMVIVIVAMIWLVTNVRLFSFLSIVVVALILLIPVMYLWKSSKNGE